MEPRRIILALVLACAATFTLAACVATDASLSNAPTVYVDKWVTRAWNPEIYVHPQEPPLEPVSALLVPLRLRARYANAQVISTELTRSLWNVWLREQVFPGLTLEYDGVWRGPQNHLDKARAGGAQLLIGGEITHLLFGGDTGTTEVALRIEAYDTATGALVWSMAHAGTLATGMTKDMIFYYQKNRMPTSPSAAIMAALGTDMAKPLKKWNFGQPKEDPKAPTPME
ncbi:hypothetical protein [Desulfocurvus sp. DL9XJH121]